MQQRWSHNTGCSGEVGHLWLQQTRGEESTVLIFLFLSVSFNEIFFQELIFLSVLKKNVKNDTFLVGEIPCGISNNLAEKKIIFVLTKTNRTKSEFLFLWYLLMEQSEIQRSISS